MEKGEGEEKKPLGGKKDHILNAKAERKKRGGNCAGNERRGDKSVKECNKRPGLQKKMRTKKKKNRKRQKTV